LFGSQIFVNSVMPVFYLDSMITNFVSFCKHHPPAFCAFLLLNFRR